MQNRTRSRFYLNLTRIKTSIFLLHNDKNNIIMLCWKRMKLKLNL